MKGRTFDSFIVHSVNQTAYDLCAGLARLTAKQKSPIVLLGDSGAGKSHLLWAIVNHYRANRVSAGIALISPASFPAVVKELASTPEKLAVSGPIVLLVDDLHRFDSNDAAILEKILFAMQEYGHAVVLATRKHPSLLSALSGKCKAFLNNGAIVGMEPLPACGRSGTDGGREGLDAKYSSSDVHWDATITDRGSKVSAPASEAHVESTDPFVVEMKTTVRNLEELLSSWLRSSAETATGGLHTTSNVSCDRTLLELANKLDELKNEILDALNTGSLRLFRSNDEDG